MYTPFGVITYTSAAAGSRSQAGIYETAKSNAISNYNGLVRIAGNNYNIIKGSIVAGVALTERVLNSKDDKGSGSESKSEDEGVIYKRKDKNGKEKDYVGQAKNDGRYEKRKKEHQRKNPDADYDFEIVERGKAGKDLNEKEQKHIDEGGGPTNKSNPNGGLQNKRNQIKPKPEPKVKEPKTT